VILHRGALLHLKLPHGEWIGQDDCRLDVISGWMRSQRERFEGKTVLDIGSNCGHFPLVYEELGATVTAVEPNADNVKVFRELIEAFHSRITLIKESIRRLPPLGRFDVLSTIGLIYHLEDPWTIMQKVLNEVKPALWILESCVWPATTTVYEGPRSAVLSCQHENVLHPTVDEVLRGARACGYDPKIIDLGPGYMSEDRTPRVFLACG